MPRKSKLKLPPLNLVKETIGKRVARLRKEKGYTQVELAEKIGITQKLISDYELDRLRPYPEMTIRLAQALGVTTDEFLGVKPSKNKGVKPNRKILRRMKEIEGLPLPQQKFLLKMIDTFLKGAKK